MQSPTSPQPHFVKVLIAWGTPGIRKGARRRGDTKKGDPPLLQDPENQIREVLESGGRGRGQRQSLSFNQLLSLPGGPEERSPSPASTAGHTPAPSVQRRESGAELQAVSPFLFGSSGAKPRCVCGEHSQWVRGCLEGGVEGRLAPELPSDPEGRMGLGHI